MKNIKYTGTDINSQANNIAWFEIDDEIYGRDEKGRVVDCDGRSVDFNDSYDFVPQYRDN